MSHTATDLYIEFTPGAESILSILPSGGSKIDVLAMNALEDAFAAHGYRNLPNWQSLGSVTIWADAPSRLRTRKAATELAMMLLARFGWTKE